MKTRDMTAQDCLELLREIRDVTFSTVDAQGHPQARVIDVMGVGEGCVTFCTARGKDFYAQLRHNPHVAVVGLSKDWQSVRLVGVARRLPDEGQRAAIDLIFVDNPSMESVYPGEARYILEAFMIDSGSLEVFDLASEPIFRRSFSLGGAPLGLRGFLIADDCVGCGTCKEGCPQQCIDEGEPYWINQESCLHCGLCYESCPVGAIDRR